MHPINPKIDCVFKAILGAEAHKNLLIDFLNAMLETSLASPIQQVELLNPYNEKEYLTDKLSIVDVKAHDQLGRTYQIEIQLATHPSLPVRMLYSWADLYSQQLHSGEDYTALNPTYAVWLLDDCVFAKNDGRYYRQFAMRDETGAELAAQGNIVVVELPKFQAVSISTGQQRWIQFFNKAETFTDPAQLPDWMHTPEMEQAMTILRQFSEKEIAYHHYQARQNFLREQSTLKKDTLRLQNLVESERAAKEQALAAQEAEKTAKEAALLKIRALEQLLAKLAKQPDSP